MANRLKQLQEDLNRINGNVNGLYAKVSRLEARLPDEGEAGAVDGELQERVAELEDRIHEIDRRSQVAFHLANQQAEDEEHIGKTRKAELVARDELVRRATIDVPAQDRPMTVREVNEKVTPEFDELDWKLVRNAFQNLVDDWPCFRITKKRGDLALTVDPDDVPEQLVYIVEESSGRNDLTERFFGEVS